MLKSRLFQPVAQAGRPQAVGRELWGSDQILLLTCPVRLGNPLSPWVMISSPVKEEGGLYGLYVSLAFGFVF